MASTNVLLVEGGMINEPPCFTDEYYNFWKTRMKNFMESQGAEVGKSIKKWLIQFYFD